jgi:hypothetical protein
MVSPISVWNGQILKGQASCVELKTVSMTGKTLHFSGHAPLMFGSIDQYFIEE